VLYTAEGEPALQLQLTRLQQQRSNLVEQQLLARSISARSQARLQARLNTTAQQNRMLHAEANLLLLQLDLQQDAEQAMGQLHAQRAVSSFQLSQAKNDRLQLQQQLQRARLTIEESELRALELEGETENLRLDLQASELRHQEQLAALDSELRRLHQQQSFAVLAERSGAVAEIPVTVSTAVRAGQALFVIDDPDATLLAVIFAPSAVAGRVTLGQQLMLRYDAYQFQQFGRYRATVNKIGRARLDPREHQLPFLDLREPVYRIEATLDGHIVRGPTEFLLRPEVQFMADFVMDEMTLLQFIVRPLAALGEKVQWKASPVFGT
ncbi:MAG: HlyD family secretion protein, partial [Gammaproteobacteria bacterium]